MFTLRFDDQSRVPRYRQIYNQIKAAILSGNLKPGNKLPTQAEWLDRYGVYVVTSARACRELAEEGLIVSRPGRGTFVADQTPKMSDTERRRRLTTQTIAYLATVAPLGFTMTEIIANIRQNFKREGAG